MNKRDKLIDFALEFVKAGMEINEVGLPSFDQLIETEYYKGKIDEILALPLDVPGDKEIHKMAYNACMKPSMPNGEPEPEHTYYDAYVHGSNDMRFEILKRNGR